MLCIVLPGPMSVSVRQSWAWKKKSSVVKLMITKSTALLLLTLSKKDELDV
jgi:hypothetical protein